MPKSGYGYPLDRFLLDTLFTAHATLAEEMLSVQQEAPQLLLYFVVDIVWHMGFNSADRQEKVSI